MDSWLQSISSKFIHWKQQSYVGAREKDETQKKQLHLQCQLKGSGIFWAPAVWVIRSPHHLSKSTQIPAEGEINLFSRWETWGANPGSERAPLASWSGHRENRQTPDLGFFNPILLYSHTSEEGLHSRLILQKSSVLLQGGGNLYPKQRHVSVTLKSQWPDRELYVSLVSQLPRPTSDFPSSHATLI